MNPAVLIRADRVELALLRAAMERAAAYRLELDRRLARLIISELSDALKRGRRR